MQKDLGRYLFYFLYKLQKRAFEPKRSRSSLRERSFLSHKQVKTKVEGERGARGLPEAR